MASGRRKPSLPLANENAGINLARLSASWAEAQSDDKTGLARHVAVKRVNDLGKVTA